MGTSSLAAQAVEPSFETAFTREVILSQRLRVKIIVGALGGALLLTLLTSLYAVFFPEDADLAYEVTTSSWWHRLGVVSLILGYELLAYAYLGRLLARGTDVPLTVRVLNALIETSFPALALVGHSQSHPAMALLGAVPFEFFFFIVLSGLQLDLRVSAITGAVAALEYALFAHFALHQPGLLAADPSITNFDGYLTKSLLMLLTGFVAGAVGRQIRRQQASALAAIEERDRTRRTFGQHVSPRVVDRLLALASEPKEETRSVCVMFVDIRGFTAFSESRAPAEVVSYLNLLFEPMIRSVDRHNGLVNKFLGDGFMAVFGAPLSDGNDCGNALAAAREIVEGVKQRVAAAEIPPTRVGIGLHVGFALTGEVGSITRREYTVIGDVVNLASRIEGLNKEFGSSLLVSEEVLKATGDALPAAEGRKLATVRGRTEPVAVYSLA